MRRAPGLRCLFFLLATGCPSTAVTSAEITGAMVVGERLIHVVGRGFVPSTLEFDLTSGTGRASSDFVLEVVRSTDGRMTPSARVDLLSPSELDAHLSARLERGTYDVRLRRADSEEPIAELEGAFVIAAEPMDPPIDPPMMDAGADAGVSIDPQADAEIPSDPDGGVASAPDAEPGYPDAALPDLGVDSGLGPFAGNYTQRQEVRLVNRSSDVAPIGTTFLIPIVHQTMIAAGMAKADGTDIALYLGATPIRYAWDDAGKLGTDQLVMIAELPEPLASMTERDRTTPLVLYYGDPNANVAPDDGVFTFVERFSGTLPAAWTTRVWTPCLFDRSSELVTTSFGAYCVYDAGSAQRVTLSSPRITAVDQNIAANLVYVLAFQLSGVMQSTNDLVYFAVDDAVAAYDQTQQLAASAWTEGAPPTSFTFEEINNFGQRTVQGWRFPAARQAWTRSVARFRSPVEDPSLHVRFLSIDSTNNAGTYVALDDYTLRLALDVELTGTLEPPEQRP